MRIARPSACCLDAHFVNVHISKLEAVAIRKTLSKLDEKTEREVYKRTKETIEKYDLTADENSFTKTFACPLFEKKVGCLVHETGKPAPCISHACYENKDDLPPDEFQETVEAKIEKLNRRVYGKNWNYLPLPLWLSLLKDLNAEGSI
ncbi:MAG: hypothetical protein M3T96_00020 [Acidobacteriota bacterium]|nr:hypothetical protein [Acidobacteriota bacterium]